MNRNILVLNVWRNALLRGHDSGFGHGLSRELHFSGTMRLLTSWKGLVSMRDWTFPATGPELWYSLLHGIKITPDLTFSNLNAKTYFPDLAFPHISSSHTPEIQHTLSLTHSFTDIDKHSPTKANLYTNQSVFLADWEGGKGGGVRKGEWERVCCYFLEGTQIV